MRLRKEIAKEHSVVLTSVRKPGVRPKSMYVLYLFSKEGPKPLLPFIDFVIETGRAASLNWQKTAARAIGLFADFLTANGEALTAAKGAPKPLALFAEALLDGTIDMEGNDPSRLFWESRPISSSRRMLNFVTEFGDWLANRLGTAKINPWRDATVAEQIAYWRRNDQRRGHQLLGYANSAGAIRDRAAKAREVVIGGAVPTFTLQPAKIFPRDRFGDLLFTGFKLRARDHEDEIHKRLCIRNLLITILLHGGGLRESEPFHLYVSDVCVDPKNPKSSLVKLFHPVDGRAPNDFLDVLTGKQIEATRDQYLRQKFQLEPRNRIEGRFKAGWKDLLLSNRRNICCYVYWFPSFWGEIFLSLFKIYITHCRSRHCRHPFLFVSEKDGFGGEPYTIESFRQAHARAVRRIGLVPLKELGTTPHGHRHEYGQNLADANVEPTIIREAMHHKAPESQEIYTAAPSLKVLKAMLDAETALRETYREDLIAEALSLNGLKLAA